MDQEWNKLLQIVPTKKASINGKQSKQCLHEKTKNRNIETLAEREVKKTSLKMIALALFIYLSIILNVNLAWKLLNVRSVDNGLDSKKAIEISIGTLQHVRVNLFLKTVPRNSILF